MTGEWSESGLQREIFGTSPEGEPVERVKIAGGGLTAWIMSWGATVQDLRLEGHDSSLVLGFPAFDPYPVHGLYFGAIVGRYANRIAGGRFVIDGVEYQADRNFLGRHLLHGGSHGTSARNWTIAQAGPDSAMLTLADRDGEMGFPGNCQLSVTFGLRKGGILALRMEAVTDRPTLVNLAHHGYFNLDGADTVLDHEVRIDAAHYLPVDDEGIPTGEISPVGATGFDLRKARPLRGDKGGKQFLYDHNYCLSGTRTGLREVARVKSPVSGVSMTLSTTEPGLQFYAGDYIDAPWPGLAGKPYGRWAGLCMEPQAWPDSPNHDDFPGALLRPGERYLQETHYCFARR